MKILYIAHERDAAALAARALQGMAADVALTWAQTPGSAVQWLEGNRDAAAVVVEVQAQSCASFVEQLRSLDLTTPIIVVAGSALLEPAVAALNAGVDGYVVAGASPESTLAEVVSLAIDRERRRRELLTGPLSDLRAERDRVEQQLARAEEARVQSERLGAAELSAAGAKLAELQARHTGALAREARVCTALQQRLFELEDALQTAAERSASESAGFADQLAKRHAEFTASLAHAAQSRDTLAAQLSVATAALDEAHQARRADADAAAGHLRRRETEFDAALAEAAGARASLEAALAAAEANHQDALRRADSELASANERRLMLEELLEQEADRRASLERQFAAADAAGQDASRRHAAEIATLREQLAEVRARYEAALDENAAARDTLDDERRAHALTRQTSESDLQRASAAHGQLRQSFEGLQTAFQTLEQVAAAHAAERARLENVVADRDGELSAQAERHRAAEQAAQNASAEVQEKFRQALEERSADVARLQRDNGALRRELDAARTHADALRRDAERVPDLQTQLQLSQQERRREFERAPYALCRCTQAGVITDANHSFATMLGRRRVDDLRNMDFAAAVFDCAGDLSWLLERTRSLRKTEPFETHWRTRDGRPLIVRLQGLATAAGSVDIIVEDVTEIRALEERLRQAQRMEAVGRLASEVAVSCDAMLRDVMRGAHEWVSAIGVDDPLRRQGERLVADVSAAATFLRQLGVYGHQEVRALERVSVQRVLRDLAPVLKRVVGDQIQLVLSKSAGAFEVDVEAERLERVLVNVAGYARQRMPGGGQMRIDLGTTAVGRRFVARYPNVRPGDHVLITVTELPGGREVRGAEPHGEPSGAVAVDLGALVELIGTCGGHLWMEAQPAGNMVVKIHLPKPAIAEINDGRADEGRSDRGGRLGRWFRSSSSATGVRA